MALMEGRSGMFGWLEPLFWSLQSYVWDDYLQLPECREEIAATADWFTSRCGCAAGRVLDVGCGTGNYTLGLARHGFEAVGLDFSGGMLDKGRAKAAQVPHVRVTFEQGDFNGGLPFPSGSFDGAICVAALQCAHDASRLLAEVRRVLKPTGVFLLVALDSSQRSEAKRRLRTTLPRLALRALKTLGNRSKRVCRPSRQELHRLLADAGFEVFEERAAAGTVSLFARV